jgi:hypothetical protein
VIEVPVPDPEPSQDTALDRKANVTVENGYNQINSTVTLTIVETTVKGGNTIL